MAFLLRAPRFASVSSMLGFYGPEQLEKQRVLGSGVRSLALLKWPELVAHLTEEV